MGASYKINFRKKHNMKPLSKSGNALLVREDQTIDSNFVFKGNAKTCNKKRELDRCSDFMTNAKELSKLSNEMDGNIVQIKRIKQKGEAYNYKLVGRAYEYIGPDSLIGRLKSHATIPDSLAGKALVAVYYPVIRHYMNAKNEIPVSINGKVSFTMTTGDQKLLVLEKGGKYKITTTDSNGVEMDLKAGEIRYIRMESLWGAWKIRHYAKLYGDELSINEVSELQGYLESEPLEKLEIVRYPTK